MNTEEKDALQQQGNPYTVRIEIPTELAHGRREEELQYAVWEGLLIRDYVNGETTIEQFAELTGMGYGEALDCLHRHGIAGKEYSI